MYCGLQKQNPDLHLGLQHGVLWLVVLQRVQQEGCCLTNGVALQQEQIVSSVLKLKGYGTNSQMPMLEFCPPKFQPSSVLITCRNRSVMVLRSIGGPGCLATILARLTAASGLSIIMRCMRYR